ncbi:MAG: NUDIX domain-containing protein [Anaerolineales bacterium]
MAGPPLDYPPGEPDSRTAQIKFCPRCGYAVVYRRVQGAVRPVCPECRRVHFLDPKVAVAIIIEREDSLLMIQRRGDPERGKWSMPAGFVDAGEDVRRAAEREAFEETGLHVRVTELLDVIPKSATNEGADILIVYRAEVVGGEVRAGDDADRAEFYHRDALPNEIAFASTRLVLERWRVNGFSRLQKD